MSSQSVPKKVKKGMVGAANIKNKKLQASWVVAIPTPHHLCAVLAQVHMP
jgi:hypothetical protein